MQHSVRCLPITRTATRRASIGCSGRPVCTGRSGTGPPLDRLTAGSRFRRRSGIHLGANWTQSGLISRRRSLSTTFVRASGALFSRSFFGLFLRKELIVVTRLRTAASHLQVASGALLSKPGPRAALLLLVMVLASWAQDPFSSLGTAAQTISTGTFVTGLVELAIVVAGLLLAFSGRVLGGVLDRDRRRGHARALGRQMGRLDSRALRCQRPPTGPSTWRPHCSGSTAGCALSSSSPRSWSFGTLRFLSALAVFVLLWSGAYWLTKHDPELVVIVPQASQSSGTYTTQAKQPIEKEASFNSCFPAGRRVRFRMLAHAPTKSPCCDS